MVGVAGMLTLMDCRLSPAIVSGAEPSLMKTRSVNNLSPVAVESVPKTVALFTGIRSFISTVIGTVAPARSVEPEEGVIKTSS